MESVWSKVLIQSLSVSVVILAVLLVRGIAMRKVPKKYVFLLWAIVGLRLLIPVGITTSIDWFQKVPDKMEQSTEKGVEKENLAQKEGKVESAGIIEEKTTNAGTQNSQSASANSSQTVKSKESQKLSVERFFSQVRQRITSEKVIQVTAYLWIGGMVLFGMWNLLMCVRMKKRLQQAVVYKDNIYECDKIGSPFVMGLVRPRIYIPFRLREEELAYILKHEQYHIMRKDYLAKLVACILLEIYWFHPLVWMAYFFMVRDMEMSCDEYVVQTMGNEIKKEYSASLLAFATNTRRMSMGMLAFGESGTRKRVKHILNSKKTAKWVGAVGVILVFVTGIFCFVTSEIGEPIKNVAKGEELKVEEEENAEKQESLSTVSTLTKGYQLEVPASWEKKEDTDIPLTKYYEKKTKVASIEEFQESWYATSVHSIVTNLYGMHASLVKQEIIRQEDGFTLVKILVEYEPSAPEQKKGKESWQEKHYLLMNGTDTFYDLWVNTEKLSEGTIAELVEHFHVTSEKEGQKEIETGEFYTVKADVTGDGIEDEIKINISKEVIEPSTEEEENVVEVISGATGKVVYTMGNMNDINLVHMGYNSLYLYHGEDKDYLLNWKPTMYQGMACYQYEIFTVNESEKKDVVEKEEFSFDLNHMKKSQIKGYKDFIEKINNRLENSVVLISTLDAKLVTYNDSPDHLLLFDPSDDLDTMNAINGGN